MTIWTPSVIRERTLRIIKEKEQQQHLYITLQKSIEEADVLIEKASDEGKMSCCIFEFSLNYYSGDHRIKEQDALNIKIGYMLDNHYTTAGFITSKTTHHQNSKQSIFVHWG